MEIVIDIPAEVFNLVMHGRFDTATEKDFTTLMRAFNDCSILPKEHGDLIDRSKVLDHEKCKFRGDCPASGGTACDKCGDNCVEVLDIKQVPVVIFGDA